VESPDDYEDPFEAHFRREPVTGAGVQVVVIAEGEPDRLEDVARGIVGLLAKRGRKAEASVEPSQYEGRGAALEKALHDSTLPLVLVTTTQERWSEGHLAPLLEAIDKSDHVVGGRKDTSPVRFARWARSRPWRWLFASPVADVHSPCRLHRREKLGAIPLQSASEFLDIEILAKATFLGHVIDEVEVPPLPAKVARGFWGDFLDVFRHPVLKRPSGPPEDPQREDERQDGPGGEDGQGGGDVEEARPFEHDPAEGAHGLGQGQGLDEGLEERGEPLGGEEDPREHPHGEHHQVHQPAGGLGGLGPAADEQADAGEGQGGDDLHQGDQQEAAADRHAEHQRAEE
jgi:hypothetical protein